MAPLREVLLKYFGLLAQADCPVMVVGAHAVMSHGVPRATGDIGLVVHGEDRLERVRTLLTETGCAPVEEVRDEWGHKLRAKTAEGILLEVFFTGDHEVHNRAFERRVTRLADGVPVAFLSVEDLILRKLVNTRLRRGPDYDDAVALLAALGDGVDLAYLRKHCGLHRVCALLDRALADAKAREP